MDGLGGDVTERILERFFAPKIAQCHIPLPKLPSRILFRTLPSFFTLRRHFISFLLPLIISPQFLFSYS